MIEKYLWIAGSIPFIILGTIHLLYTFFTNKFSVRNKDVEEKMKISFPVLTSRTTMWKTWIGFNASHSAGAIFIGVVDLFIALNYFFILRESLFLLLFHLVTILFYLWLGKKYWFSIPFTGILVSSCCFVAATILILIK